MTTAISSYMDSYQASGSEDSYVLKFGDINQRQVEFACSSESIAIAAHEVCTDLQIVEMLLNRECVSGDLESMLQDLAVRLRGE